VSGAGSLRPLRTSGETDDSKAGSRMKPAIDNAAVGSGRRRRVSSWSHILAADTHFEHGPAGWKRAVAVGGPLIPRGAGRSLGDSAYSPNGTSCVSLPTSTPRVEAGAATMDVDSGTTLGQVHAALDGGGFEFPLFGGTQWVTVGGAVAGDIHGKNHLDAGSFGHHVQSLTLLTSDGTRLVCSPARSSDLFRATIGGMGLTGFIEKATLTLRPNRGKALRVERRLMTGIAEVHEGLCQSGAAFQFATCPHLTARIPRALHFAAARTDLPCSEPRRSRRIALPRMPLVGARLMRGMSNLVLNRGGKSLDSVAHIRDFNYSGLHELLFGWNQLYCRGGMIAYQLVLPDSAAVGVLDRLAANARRRSIPLLWAIFKRFGEHAPAGLISFAQAGTTLNFQTPWSKAAVEFLRSFSDEVADAGGRINLTKDCCASPAQIERMYGNLEAWRGIVRRHDPGNRIRSALADRLSLKPW
jgi:FAD/FMN-containing dehydrogenase